MPSFFFAGRNLGFTLHLYHIIELELQTSSEPHSKELKNTNEWEKEEEKVLIERMVSV